VGAPARGPFGRVAVLWLLATSHTIDPVFSVLTTPALRRWTDIEIRDYTELLHLAGAYKVVELAMRPGDWTADKTPRLSAILAACR
jgi:hypothetical protein